MIIKRYTHDHNNDTVLEFNVSQDRAEIACTFSSEDPDYGSEELILGGDAGETAKDLAEDLLKDIVTYLNGTNNGLNRTDDAPLAFVFGDYNNSTLYAVEAMLTEYVRDGK